MDTKDLIELFLKKKNITPKEVADVIEKLDLNKFGWRDLGDLENNHPRINIVSSAEHTIVERITNAIDSCIEKKALEKPEIMKLKGIGDVSKYFFENDLWDKDKNINIEIFPLSKDIGRTNFSITDNGIGIENKRMPYTILDFNSSYKKAKDYLLGNFGQGGSTVCRYSFFTIIITQKDEETSFTIIRNNEEVEGEERYEYLVDKNNRDLDYNVSKQRRSKKQDFLPPFIRCQKGAGTTVIHVGYDLYKKGNAFINYWKIFDENLFNSFLPYKLSFVDEGETYKRTMNGLKNRLETLNRKGEVIKNWTDTLPLENNETAKIVYYYLKDKTAKDGGYISDAAHPIFVTFNGQSHARLRRSLISNANLSKLINKIVIEVNCNFLSKKLKNKFFDSGRQNIEKKYEKILEKSITEFLLEDIDLRREQERLEEEERAKEIGENTEEYRKELASMIESTIPGKYKVNKPGLGNGKKPTKKKKPGSLKEVDDINLLEIPEYFKINRDSDDIFVPKNQEKILLELESNITDKSFSVNGCKIEIDKRASKVQAIIPRLSNGRARVSVILKDTEVGDKILIKFYLKSRSKNINLDTETKYIHIEKAKDKKGNTAASIDAPTPIEVYKDGKNSNKYKEFEWNEKERFSKVEKGSGINIYVNMSHSELEDFVDTIDSKKIEKAKSDYFLNIALASFLQDEDEIFRELNVDVYEKSDELKDRSLSVTAKTLFSYIRKNNKG